jgi:hypothetical protein
MFGCVCVSVCLFSCVLFCLCVCVCVFSACLFVTVPLSFFNSIA